MTVAPQCGKADSHQELQKPLSDEVGESSITWPSILTPTTSLEGPGPLSLPLERLAELGAVLLTASAGKGRGTDQNQPWERARRAEARRGAERGASCPQSTGEGVIFLHSGRRIHIECCQPGKPSLSWCLESLLASCHVTIVNYLS